MKEGQTLHATVEKEYCPAMQLQQEGKLQGWLIQNEAGQRKKKGRIRELSRPSPERPTEHFRRLTS
jgi:hypothetical protein